MKSHLNRFNVLLLAISILLLFILLELIRFHDDYMINEKYNVPALEEEPPSAVPQTTAPHGITC